MPIVPSFVTLRPEQSTITLSRYCVSILHYPEWMFWGVRRTGDPDYQCKRYWLKRERDMIARNLAKAQSEIEAQTAFPIGARWFADEEVAYSFPLATKWGEIVEAGAEARTTIEADSAVTHNADDASGNPVDSTVTVTTTVTDVDEIRVYYPASLGVEGPVEIDPSDIDVAGGVATISIPRWRLVHPSVADNPAGGLDYTDLTNFLSVVDVVRVYNDPSTNATLIWPHSCGNGNLCACTCSDYRRDGCIYVKDSHLGYIDVLPATYSGGSWTRSSRACRCAPPAIALVNYRAGIEPGHRYWEDAVDAIVRLAHTKMPEEPCGCEVAQRMWGMDRAMPEVGTRERINCPFGLSAGAWTAWKFAMAMKTYRTGLVL